MVKRTASSPDSEPDQKVFVLPSEKEHLFQVVDFIDSDNPDIILTKLEVVGGEEEGRSLIQRVSLDDGWKGFFATRLFLKAIGEPYHGKDFPIDTDNWPGRQFYAIVIHNESKGKTYANIKEYNFEKMVDNSNVKKSVKSNEKVKSAEEIEWDADIK